MYQMLFTALVREWLCCAKTTLAVLELFWISGWRHDEVQNQVCGLKSNSTNSVFPHLIVCYLSACLFSLRLSVLHSFSLTCCPPYLFSTLSLPPCLCPLYLSPIVPCLPSSFMFGVSRVTPPHCHGHAHRCADVCRVDVCVQEEQAADSWAKAETYALLREGDSEEERERETERYTKG